MLLLFSAQKRANTGGVYEAYPSAESNRRAENNAYCPDILMQSAAVTAAMNAFNKELLASHIRTCVAQDIRDGKDEVIDELVGTLQKLMK